MTHPIIALSGPPGCGKSTLIAEMVHRYRVHAVYFDAHEQMTDRTPTEMEGWIARDMPLEEMLPAGLTAHLREAARTAPVLFETPLGRAVAEHSRLVQWSVWLDLPGDLALARKIKSTIRADDWPSSEAACDWLRGYLEAYPRIVAPCLAMQAARVRPLADEVVDARLEPARLADLISDRLVLLASAGGGLFGPA